MEELDAKERLDRRMEELDAKVQGNELDGKARK
jgi:hypothetical protein